MATPKLADLWRHYSKAKIGGGCTKHTYQCAMRMSAALARCGFKLGKSYKDVTCTANGVRHARGAQSLANYLSWKIKRPKKSPGFSAHSTFNGKQGIIFFQNITGFRGGAGDHIDLWYLNTTKTGAYFGRSSWVWFWELK